MWCVFALHVVVPLGSKHDVGVAADAIGPSREQAEDLRGDVDDLDEAIEIDVPGHTPSC
jgi:hypothetical protein